MKKMWKVLFPVLLLTVVALVANGCAPSSTAGIHVSPTPTGSTSPTPTATATATPTATPTPTPDPTIFAEYFTGATTDSGTGFFTITYRFIPGYSSIPMFRAVGGASSIGFPSNNMTIADGVSGARFTIGEVGSPPGTYPATASGTLPYGSLNLTGNYRISFTVVSQATAGGNFQIFIDNNGTSASAGTSYHGAASRVYSQLATGLTPGTYTVDVSIGTTTSFIQFRCESGVRNMVIDNIVVTRLP
jgi:hypothetical protein